MSRRPHSPMKRQPARQNIQDIQRLLAEGLGHHQAGRSAQAEALYRRILRLDARHAESLHLLGMLAYAGRPARVAVERIREAIAICGTEASYYSNLGAVLQAQDRLEEAVACYERALDVEAGLCRGVLQPCPRVAVSGKARGRCGHHERMLR